MAPAATSSCLMLMASLHLLRKRIRELRVRQELLVGERPEKRDQRCLLGPCESERLLVPVILRALVRNDDVAVVVDQRVNRREAAIMAVGSRHRNVTERRRLEQAQVGDL